MQISYLSAWAVLAPSICAGVVSGEPTTHWTRDASLLRPSLELPLEARVDWVELPLPKLRLRIVKAESDPTVEPVFLITRREDDYVSKLVEKYGRFGKESALVKYLHSHAGSFASVEVEGLGYLKVRVTPELYQLLDRQALSERFQTAHQRLVVDSEELRADTGLEGRFLAELEPFFDSGELAEIRARLLWQDRLVVDEELLPEFAAKLVRKFVIYRGPNCFHASLAFQNPLLARSRFFNVKEEEGYHRAMINYDELWRVLRSCFYEINPIASPLKYGDILVFFGLPSPLPPSEVNFRWIRHTATYLFNHYTFSKGSKSPDTPYTVKTVAGEWASWQRLTKNLAVKIFRRSSKNVRKRPPKDLVDWIY